MGEGIKEGFKGEIKVGGIQFYTKSEEAAIGNGRFFLFSDFLSKAKEQIQNNMPHSRELKNKKTEKDKHSRGPPGHGTEPKKGKDASVEGENGVDDWI